MFVRHVQLHHMAVGSIAVWCTLLQLFNTPSLGERKSVIVVVSCVAFVVYSEFGSKSLF